jgi:hypothetical protein
MYKRLSRESSLVKLDCSINIIPDRKNIDDHKTLSCLPKLQAMEENQP